MGAGFADGDPRLRHGLCLHRLAADRRASAKHTARISPVGGCANTGFRKSVHCQAPRPCCRSRSIPMFICFPAAPSWNSRAAAMRPPNWPAMAHGEDSGMCHLPLARTGIVAGVALALMETLADFGTVSYFAVNTFTAGIYRAWLSLGDSVAAGQLATCLLVFVLAMLALERMHRGGARYTSNRTPMTAATACAASRLLGAARCVPSRSHLVSGACGDICSSWP